MDAALTYYSAATNLPTITDISYRLRNKDNKYFLNVAGGAVSVVPRGNGKGIDPLANQLGASNLLTFSNATYGMFAAVVLDLDGNGADLVLGSRSHALFDYNGDGRGNDTAWIGSHDGFLVIDRDNDGLITKQSELDLALEAEGARSGLEGLSALDSNRDGQVDAGDARFRELKVWMDANGNGITDAGELRSLAEAGIDAIRLGRSAVSDQMALGSSAAFATASFVRHDGTTSTVADAMLSYTVDGARVSPSTSGDIASDDTGEGGFADWQGASTGSRRDALGLLRPWLADGAREDFAVSPRQGGRPIGHTRVTGNASEVSTRLDMLRETLEIPLERVATTEEHEGARTTQDLAAIRSSISEPKVAGDFSSASQNLAVRLALLRQDMAAFGARGVDGLSVDRNAAGMIQDWFA